MGRKKRRRHHKGAIDGKISAVNRKLLRFFGKLFCSVIEVEAKPKSISANFQQDLDEVWVEWNMMYCGRRSFIASDIIAGEKKG